MLIFRTETFVHRAMCQVWYKDKKSYRGDVGFEFTDRSLGYGKQSAFLWPCVDLNGVCGTLHF